MADAKLRSSGSSRPTQENADSDNRVDRDYFAWPHFSYVILSFIIQYFILTVAFAPTTFPGFLGPLASFGTKFGLNYPNICLLMAILTYVGHLYESYEASKVCRQLQLSESASKKWIFSTFVFGIFSLGPLKSLLKKKGA